MGRTRAWGAWGAWGWGPESSDQPCGSPVLSPLSRSFCGECAPSAGRVLGVASVSRVRTRRGTEVRL